MDLRTGNITRVTDIVPPLNVNKPTKTPCGSHLLYTVRQDLVLHDTKTGERKVIYTVPDGWVPGRLTLNCDMTMAAILQNERPPVEIKTDSANHYATFMDRFFRIKRSRVDVIDLITGEARCVRYESHHGGHLQFSPTNPRLLMFCHEGPWHIVAQRIWLLDAITGEITPCYRQGANDCVGHEFWTRSGNIFFDNRGPDHDGTITSERTQAIIKDKRDLGVLPIIGHSDEKGNILNTIEIPYYCNHYHSASNEQLLVGDDIDDIMLIDISQDPPTHTVLARHATSWKTQASHCHPTFGWKDKRVLYTSDYSGNPQLYMVELE
jgi:oligogalacturonide lyase